MPSTVVILVALFAVQSKGTARVAAFFGPITVVWFVAIAIPGVSSRLPAIPRCSLAFNPVYGDDAFCTTHGVIGLITLGAVFLAVTGAEALYADLGHFGRKPIQTAWVGLVLPALALNYLGQGALLLADPKALENPFFLLYPDMGAVADGRAGDRRDGDRESGRHHAAPIPSAQQGIQLGLLPRLEIRHTSEAQYGQIYMPRVNFVLLVGVLLLVGHVPILECACVGLWHCRDRNDGCHRR